MQIETTIQETANILDNFPARIDGMMQASDNNNASVKTEVVCKMRGLEQEITTKFNDANLLTRQDIVHTSLALDSRLQTLVKSYIQQENKRSNKAEDS